MRLATLLDVAEDPQVVPPSAGAALEDVVRRALTDLVGYVGVGRAGVALSEGGGRRLLFTSSDRTERERGAGLDWCHIDAYDDVPLTTVMRTGKPVAGALDDLDARYAAMLPGLRERQVVALAAVPLPGPSGASPLGGLLAYLSDVDSLPFVLAALRRRAQGLAAELQSARSRAVRDEALSSAAPSEAEAPDADTTSFEVPPDARAVGGARRQLRASLDEWGVDEDTTDTACLCLSELVTNAVIHAETPSEVTATLHGGVLTVAVRDDGRREGTTPRSDPDPLRVHGRGLDLVDALSVRWGTEPDRSGTTVWFVLEVGA
ncbi:MAG: hypothetical protein CMH83_01680 [Nocardioides sp.]|nr:hypothetical protein [Nocardioides sp.]